MSVPLFVGFAWLLIVGVGAVMALRIFDASVKERLRQRAITVIARHAALGRVVSTPPPPLWGPSIGVLVERRKSRSNPPAGQDAVP